MNLPKYCDLFVSYELMLDDADGRLEKKTFETPRIANPETGCQWDYVQTHVFSKVTDNIIDYLSVHNLCFELKGRLRKDMKASTRNILMTSEQFIDTTDSRSIPQTNDSSKNASVNDSRAIEDHNWKVAQNQQTVTREVPAKETGRPKEKQKETEKKKKKSKGFLSFFGL